MLNTIGTFRYHHQKHLNMIDNANASKSMTITASWHLFLHSLLSMLLKRYAGRRRFKRTCQNYGIYESCKHHSSSNAPLLVLLWIF